ncbi:leucine-rich repeat protein lrrA-like [Monomorium pharaonis]|uniref:leucine-rich repeat protein lrrA-like n=1 Tax=Monomorium pharaonis TaxID=307658 RepID=UPI001746882A|nr:leucine-rich repeat protein lrrA-like [Monomorium pharaonis]
MRNSYYLEKYNPLSRNFSNIMIYLNLVYVNLSNNMLTSLPKAFGSLPHLRQLDLSNNSLGIYKQTKWPWVEQIAIQKTLLILEIACNSLNALPRSIGELSALRVLNVSHNMLRYLPHSIGNIQNLEILDLSCNILFCLPITFQFLGNLVYLDVSMNPFHSIQVKKNDTQIKKSMRSLVDLSANSVLQYGILYDKILPHTLIEYLKEAKSCFFCHLKNMNYLPRYWFGSIDVLNDNVEYSPEEMLPFEFYVCSYDLSRFSAREMKNRFKRFSLEEISNKEDHFRKKRRILEGKIEITEESRHKKEIKAMEELFYCLTKATYNLFVRKFNNITRWLYLTNLNLSNNGIKDLPIELGTLPFIKILNLSHNRIGISYRYRWLWINQTEIRNSLHITKLPYYIVKLKALILLKATHNMLKCLPESIANMKSLIILDVSYNSLLCLPSTMLHLNLQLLDISMNPCLTADYRMFKYQPLSLAELSVSILHRFSIAYLSILPNTLIEYIDIIRRCSIPSRVCYISYVVPIANLRKFKLAGHVSKNTLEGVRSYVQLEYIRRFPP